MLVYQRVSNTVNSNNRMNTITLYMDNPRLMAHLYTGLCKVRPLCLLVYKSYSLVPYITNPS
jgi:hypothetical protein